MAERDPQTFALIGAAMEVHNELGSGLLEPAYQEAFAVELDLRCIASEREKPFEILYKHVVLASKYRADFIYFDEILVELKAVKKLTDKHRAQVINYLKISKLERGLLINFGGDSLEYERFTNKYIS